MDKLRCDYILSSNTRVFTSIAGATLASPTPPPPIRFSPLNGAFSRAFSFFFVHSMAKEKKVGPGSLGKSGYTQLLVESRRALSASSNENIGGEN